MHPRLSAPFFLAIALSACGTSPPPDAAAPVATATPDEPPEKHDDTATLDVTCAPSGEVKVDGKSIGPSPISAYKVPPGQHDVTCVDERTGPQTMTYTLEPGEGRSVSMGRPPNAVDTPPPDTGKKPPKK